MIQSLDRGIQALIYLSKRRAAGVTEVAEELGINKSTAFRILETLMESNMVAQDKAMSKYKLGPGILRLSSRLIKNLNIISLAKPLIVKLVETTGESAHLCMLSNDSAIIIEQAMSGSRLAVHAKVGSEEPVYCSSVGKCLLAFADEQKRENIISKIKFEKYTKNTITGVSELRRELEKIEAQGYAVDNEEISEDILCVAAPVHDISGTAVYSLGISGPKTRTKDKIGELADDVVRAAQKLSEQLGYFND